MSVTTTADECLIDAKEYIIKASDCLLEAMKSDTFGSDEFSYSYIIQIQTREGFDVEFGKLEWIKHI